MRTRNEKTRQTRTATGKCGSRCGFTLTEMAIVLGVIGVVTTGIFLAGSVVQYRIKIDQGSDELANIASNMRSLYAGRNVAAAGGTVPFPGAVFVQEGVFPPEMLVPSPPPGTIPAVGTIANNPWDQSDVKGTAQIDFQPAGGGPAKFDILYENIPYDVCTDLLVKNSTPGPEIGLLQIQVSGIAVAPLPITAVAAAAACPAAGGAGVYNIDWTYTL